MITRSRWYSRWPQRPRSPSSPGPDPAAVIIAKAPTDGAKTREPETARAVLETLDLRDVTVTADALHTVKATAELIHQQGGHFVRPVKENRPALFDALNALPWATTPIGHESTEVGHGRTTRRTIRVLPAPPGLESHRTIIGAQLRNGSLCARESLAR